MEDKIKLLPEKVANQIAAGEVVNRPASVVKEMMENAIDAGATEVIVNYRRNGQDLIQIVDNGIGMTPNDARMAFERHATSKISEADDIYALHTFGFRGEALASICAVSQVELRSRHRDSDIGTTTTINGGVFADQQPIACEVGSQFFVRNLFYNLPARRTFLEKDSRPKHIKEEFKRVALCNPSASFELYADDTPIYRLSPTTLAGRIVDVVGNAIKNNLLEVHADTQIVKVSGYIGRPKAAKKSFSDQYMFVNGRYFRSPSLFKAILKGYEKIIPVGYNPAFFLFLEVAPDRIDVNIHPQKTEVKFADDELIWQIINAAVRETLARTGSIPMMEFDEESSIEIPVAKKGVSYAEPRATMNADYNPFAIEAESELIISEGVPKRSYNPTKSHQSLDSVNYEEWESSFNPPIEEEWSDLVIEEEVEEAPLLIDSTAKPKEREHEVSDVLYVSGHQAWTIIDGDMTLVDLRRARERTLYDYYLSSYKSGEVVSQQIMFPIELRLSESEYALMSDNAIEFSVLGFDIEYCGKELIMVKGLPSDVTSESVDRLIYDLLQTLSTPLTIADEMRREMARIMARSSAKSINRHLSQREAKEIIDQLVRGGNIGHTPNGKAIMWQITKGEIKDRLG